MVISNPFPFLNLFSTSIEEIVAVNSATRTRLLYIKTMAMIRPPLLVGYLSPYPTVVIVTTAHHIDSPSCLKYGSPGFEMMLPPELAPSKNSTMLALITTKKKIAQRIFVTGFFRRKRSVLRPVRPNTSFASIVSIPGQDWRLETGDWRLGKARPLASRSRQ